MICKPKIMELTSKLTVRKIFRVVNVSHLKVLRSLLRGSAKNLFFGYKQILLFFFYFSKLSQRDMKNYICM